MKKFLKVIFVIVAVIFVIGFIGSLFDNKKDIQKTEITQSEDTTLYKYFEIEYSDIDRPTQRNLSVFISDTTKIKVINELLVSRYSDNKSNSMGFTYFDNKHIAEIYQKKIWDKNTSDIEGEQLFKHVIANYNFNPSTKYESLEYMHHEK
ncbi:MAG: hypothetical protein WCG93_12100 [Paludibacter sp.]